MRKLIIGPGLRFLLLVAVAASMPSAVLASSSYYASRCAGCHGATPTTCNGCHHHGASGLSASANKATYAPGETITVTVNSSSRGGWWRAVVRNGSTDLASTTATGTSATVTTTAPTTAGSYTWQGAWFGNDDSGGSHVYANANFSFTVQAAQVTCTSFTYSAWSACGANGQQTRTVVSSAPAGCTGGSPVLTQACTPPPATCTSFTYSAWSACDANGQQSRTVASATPAGCTGGSPVLTQACTPPQPTTCTSFTYSAWSACDANGQQSRTVASASPAGCTGGSPVLTQACTPPPTGACTSCHGAPPASGKHALHTKEHVGCGDCHGRGYDLARQTVNAATHQNGKIELRRALRWNATAQTCTGCHEKETWKGEGDCDHEEDDFAIVDDAEAVTGGCSSTGGPVTALALAGIGLLAAFRRRRAR